MDIPLLSNTDFCGPPNGVDIPGYAPPTTLLTIRDLLSDRALTVKRPRQQSPSLIFRLPPELLAEVFMHATAEDTPSTFLPMHMHIVVSHVCGLWRAVMMHAPSMWSRVVLHLGGRTKGFRQITNLAKTCFERSYELPLTLIITSSVFTASMIPNLSMDLVLPVRHRIRHLELALPAVFTESLFKLPKNSLKSLQSISICALVSDREGGWFHSMSALEGAPLLDTVKFRCLHPDNTWQGWRRNYFPSLAINPHVAGLPWEQLTELRLEDLEINCEEALYVLEMATGLLHFTSELRFPEPISAVITFTNLATGLPTPAPAPSAKDRVIAPALLDLELLIDGWTTAPADFFGRLILPSLKELSIKYKFRQELLCETLTALQACSSFSLERFTLVNRAGDSLAPFLQTNPLLVRLQLAFCSVELVPLVSALTRRRGGSTPPLLPMLAALTLADRWAEETPSTTWFRATKAVVDMVRSRWYTQDDASAARLGSFTFGSRVGMSEKKVARLDGCRKDGMRYTMVLISKREFPAVPADYNLVWGDD
ncbi:hypothetical protein B0H10DRAFT_2023272 [Mycena sp. CBHHK59/15]|nr:hypothetical protein B0H10DRAFT_2023272 [Mycena sp. CBHHK59/15]